MATKMENSLGEGFVSLALNFGTDRKATSETMDGLKKYAKQIREVRQSQIRRYYREIKAADLDSIVMLRPQLAYGIGRANAGIGESSGKELAALLEDLELIITKLESQVQLDCFKSFMESLLAYHKMFGKN